MIQNKQSKSGVFQIRITLAPIVICCLVFSCNQNPSVGVTTMPAKTEDTLKPKYTKAMVDNRKDPSCGMPLTADIEDTVHYMGKVYGFCSVECKQAFLKNPGELAKNADLK